LSRIRRLRVRMERNEGIAGNQSHCVDVLKAGSRKLRLHLGDVGQPATVAIGRSP